MSTQEMFWGNLLHLSFNMWCDRDAPAFRESQPYRQAQPYLRFDEQLWRDITARMSEIGMNAVVIDVGDGIQFSSHPEISVEGAWSQNKLKDELKRLRDLGLEAIPKMNFSTTHDVWLKEYSRMVSTPQYYRVCRDLIEETINLFDGSRLFHLGMDEETASHQKHNAYAVMRQHELWWHDLQLLVDAVEKSDSRAWIWSDYIWHHQKEFLKLMPKTVMQSNWYYGDIFHDFEEDDLQRIYVGAYDVLAQRGYDQIPTMSNYYQDSNAEGTVKYFLEEVPREQLRGFLMTPWKITLEAHRKEHFAALDQMQTAKRLFEEGDKGS